MLTKSIWIKWGVISNIKGGRSQQSKESDVMKPFKTDCQVWRRVGSQWLGLEKPRGEEIVRICIGETRSENQPGHRGLGRESLWETSLPTRGCRGLLPPGKHGSPSFVDTHWLSTCCVRAPWGMCACVCVCVCVCEFSDFQGLPRDTLCPKSCHEFLILCKEHGTDLLPHTLISAHWEVVIKVVHTASPLCLLPQNMGNPELLRLLKIKKRTNLNSRVPKLCRWHRNIV